ncbi:YicC family protein [Frigidibacter sp. RF13]|uniref:YicC/YloC family endoribonuclease n=1 Tax=Frigidibacter sp. RF13 TaxID=2997340 RepID=UPI002270D7D3|nr:YicC/YloC family endoribonuclease [Frigidibacter sp. RF13]MCY1125431.1 YicC family protein [Frigidibacter sp. RF13]
MVKGTLNSMTGFAARRGEGAGASWTWDIRSVNGKGFDLRLRLPDGIEGLESAVRTAVSARVARGNVSVTLRLTQEASADSYRVNEPALHAALAALGRAEAAARAAGFETRALSPADILGVKGVLDTNGGNEEQAKVLPALLADLDGALADFATTRAQEGAALASVISSQADRIATLVGEAGRAAEARRPQMEATLGENLARVLAGAGEADPNRVAQELALLVVKADVTEELDRLSAHIVAARKLLADGGAVGKRFDFLMQEFMREANTLCSKSGNVELTRIGLDLKTLIDQMREQVQNVE